MKFSISFPAVIYRRDHEALPYGTTGEVIGRAGRFFIFKADEAVTLPRFLLREELWFPPINAD